MQTSSLASMFISGMVTDKGRGRLSLDTITKARRWHHGILICVCTFDGSESDISRQLLKKLEECIIFKVQSSLLR